MKRMTTAELDRLQEAARSGDRHRFRQAVARVRRETGNDAMTSGYLTGIWQARRELRELATLPGDPAAKLERLARTLERLDQEARRP